MELAACCDCGTPIPRHATRSRCHDCFVAYQKVQGSRYYREHVEEWRATRRRWRETHPDRVRELRRQHDGVRNPRSGLCKDCGTALADLRFSRCPACTQATVDQARRPAAVTPRPVPEVDPISCSRCGGARPAGRKHPWCPECMRAYNQAHYAADADAQRERSRRWAETNPEKVAAKRERYRDQGRASEHSQNSYWRRLETARADSRSNQARRRAQMKTGSATRVDYEEILQASGGVCATCGDAVGLALLHIDHILPLTRGGEHVRDNLQALCQPCNQRKYNKLPDELTPPPR